MRSWMLAQERLADQPQPGGARQGQFQTGGGLALIRIHDITSQLAAELGASAEATQLAEREITIPIHPFCSGGTHMRRPIELDDEDRAC